MVAGVARPVAHLRFESSAAALEDDVVRDGRRVATRRAEIGELRDYRLPDFCTARNDAESHRRSVTRVQAVTGHLRGLRLADGALEGTVWLADEATALPGELRGHDVVLVIRGWTPGGSPAPRSSPP